MSSLPNSVWDFIRKLGMFVNLCSFLFIYELLKPFWMVNELSSPLEWCRPLVDLFYILFLLIFIGLCDLTCEVHVISFNNGFLLYFSLLVCLLKSFGWKHVSDCLLIFFNLLIDLSLVVFCTWVCSPYLKLWSFLLCGSLRIFRVWYLGESG